MCLADGQRAEEAERIFHRQPIVPIGVGFQLQGSHRRISLRDLQDAYDILQIDASAAVHISGSTIGSLFNTDGLTGLERMHFAGALDAGDEGTDHAESAEADEPQYFRGKEGLDVCVHFSLVYAKNRVFSMQGQLINPKNGM